MPKDGYGMSQKGSPRDIYVPNPMHTAVNHSSQVFTVPTTDGRGPRLDASSCEDSTWAKNYEAGTSAHVTNYTNPVAAAPEAGTNIDFEQIRVFCETDGNIGEVDLKPDKFKEHRKQFWLTGLPNSMGARRVLPTDLNLEAWEHYLAGSGEDRDLLDGIKYGFPLGYAGPVSDTSDSTNHPSALNYPDQVQSFLDKERALRAVIGPLAQKPFVEWVHIAPMMSREKSTSNDRRIISDLTFPAEFSINAFIKKNTTPYSGTAHRGVTQSRYRGIHVHGRCLALLQKL